VSVDVETVRYRIKRILKLGLIRRFTTIARKPPKDYSIAFLANYELAPGIVERYNEARTYYTTIDGKLPLFNSFHYLALLSGSYLLFGLGSFENEETAIKQAIMEHKEIYKEDNPEVSYGKITNVIKGAMPIRNIDLGKDYRSINWSAGKQLPNKSVR
jgi:DNA-binding Lrp family transcriptional regulator